MPEGANWAAWWRKFILWSWSWFERTGPFLALGFPIECSNSWFFLRKVRSSRKRCAMTEEWGIEDWIPTELLCYAFTFLCKIYLLPSVFNCFSITTRTKERCSSLLALEWSFDSRWKYEKQLLLSGSIQGFLVWEKNYIRFFGTPEPKIAETIENWSAAYRRRAALIIHLE